MGSIRDVPEIEFFKAPADVGRYAGSVEASKSFKTPSSLIMLLNRVFVWF